MPGQVTPFDPTTQTRDGDYIGFFLTKKNPLKPLISTSTIISSQKTEETKVWNEIVHEDDGTESKQKSKETEKTEDSSKTIESDSVEKATTEAEASEESTSRDTSETETPAVETTKDEENPIKSDESTSKADESSQTEESSKDEESSKTEETAKTDEVSKSEDSKETGTEKAEAEEKENSSGLVSRKRTDQDSAMVDSSAVYTVGVLAQVDRKNASGPRLRFLYHARFPSPLE